MEEVISVLKELGSGTGSGLAKYLNRKPQEVIADLKLLQEAGRADCVNGIWRARGRARLVPVEEKSKAGTAG